MYYGATCSPLFGIYSVVFDAALGHLCCASGLALTALSSFRATALLFPNEFELLLQISSMFVLTWHWSSNQGFYAAKMGL